MKKLYFAIGLCLILWSFTACGEKKAGNGGSADTPAGQEQPSPSPTAEPTVEPTPEPTPEPTAKPTPDPAAAQGVIDEIWTAVQGAFGEKGLPVMMSFTAEAMADTFSIDAGLFDAFTAQAAMMSTQIDKFVAVHAAEGNVQAVEEALLAYREKQINDTLQYPGNLLKIQASRVVVVDQYVFFFTLGSIGNTFETEDEALLAHEANAALVLEAVQSVLDK